MGISGTYDRFFSDTEQAFKSFTDRKTPFAAIKLKLPKQVEDKRHIKNIVLNNFRKADKIFSRDSRTYAILMNDTPIDAAMAASTRLASRLSQVDSSPGKASHQQILQTSLDIVGTGDKTTKMQRASLDLSQETNFYSRETDSGNIPFKYKAYIKCARLAGSNKGQHNRISVNITV